MKSWDRYQIAYFVGLVVSICTALGGQAELLGEPLRHYVTVVGVVGTAVMGYLLQPPRGAAQTRVDDPPEHKPKDTP